jgi:hypothetical protein
MAAFLMIENPGSAPSEAFTLLGATTKRDNSKYIGTFGSGNKHGIAVLLRHRVSPQVFSGNLKMEFTTKPVSLDDGIDQTDFARVVVKYGGKDEEGVNRSSTEDLGFVLEYGASDWLGVDLALREFVSNAIDHAIKHNEHTEADVKTPWEGVLVEVVDEKRVRAKKGVTRVFVPLTDDVMTFYRNLGKWFLHFSEPHLIGQTILPKGGRNLVEDCNQAVIYRRGVRVREFTSGGGIPSLFDYNLEDLKLDESRQVDDWAVKNAAASAIRDAEQLELVELFNSFTSTDSVWEHTFDTYGLRTNSWNETNEQTEARQEKWKGAIQTAIGDDAVVVSKDDQSDDNRITRKGFKTVAVPSEYAQVADQYGLRTASKVLSQDERLDREIIDPTLTAQAAVDFVWTIAEIFGQTGGKDKPPVKSFRGIMDAEAVTQGFYREGVVYLNVSVAKVGEEVPQKHFSDELLATAIEEVAHYVTGATDNSRDFQEWFIQLSVKAARQLAEI